MGGPRHEVALASVAWDGAGEVGCVHPTEFCLVRPTALVDGDAEAEEVVRSAGGALRIASGFNDPAVKAMICGSAMAIAWQVGAVYPLVESAVLRETARPWRTLALPDTPGYGCWPAPWLPWVSASSAVSWSEPPFSEQVQNGVEGLRNDAFAAVGLPPVTIGAHPIAKAMVLAALLRSVPWKGDGTSLGGVPATAAGPEHGGRGHLSGTCVPRPQQRPVRGVVCRWHRYSSSGRARDRTGGGASARGGSVRCQATP